MGLLASVAPAAGYGVALVCYFALIYSSVVMSGHVAAEGLVRICSHHVILKRVTDLCNEESSC